MVASTIASFIVPVAVDVVVDDVPDSDELNSVGVGDGELDNGSLSLTRWVMVKLIEFNRMSPRNSVLGAMRSISMPWCCSIMHSGLFPVQVSMALPCQVLLPSLSRHQC